MTTTVALSTLATFIEDDAQLTTKFLFPKDVRLHRHMEYLWGLEIYTIDPTHERSILHIRKSMGGIRTWTLAPTEKTLAAMKALQTHNFTDPVSERTSFLTEFSAAEYEYIFVPLYTEDDFFVLEPGRAPQRFGFPYTNFPRVTCSANPFFVTFYSRPKIQRFHASTSKTWHRLFGDITMQWCACPLPEEFLLSCYPDTLISETVDDEPKSKSGSEETVVTPMEEGPSPVPDKESFVYDWVRRDARQPHERLVLGSPAPRPLARLEDYTGKRKNSEASPPSPRWPKESKRGMESCERLFKRTRCI
ncbi:hypothetical protein B0H13DRAFT_2069849 [Mycena leptocephala]|nr:hypothetical protein B0H13DRAFT_2069849 [Mycena leptocephala]